MDVYQKICDSNLSKYGTESEKVLRIIINQYSDRTHFIYEILQNAEDAGASRISFHLLRDSLEICHDGRPFDEEDIDGVCGIANGTKEDGTRIGHFGIGFKSVYCYTESPNIHSGNYHFSIKNQLFPKEISAYSKQSAVDTYMILPFNKQDVPADIAYKEIKEALTQKITADSILMLDNIENVTIQIDGYDEKISISKIKNRLDRLNNGMVYSLGMSTSIVNQRTLQERTTDKDYLFFSDDQAESSAIVYLVGGTNNRQLLPIKNSKIYAYFPTAKESHQNFYIHAPFDTTPARDNFKEGAEYGKHNLNLIDNICDLITSSLMWMKDNDYLSFRGFNTVFPIYEYDENDVLRGIYDNSVDIINSGIAVLPTNIPGTYESIENICVPQISVIVDVFDDNDLHRLINSSKYWLAKDISSEAASSLKSFLFRNFNLATIGWASLVTKMDARFLEQKKEDWFEQLFSHIESFCIKRSYTASHFINVEKIPLVRTDDGKHICARDDKGRLLVYLNNHKIAKYRISEAFLRNESIRSFYQNALQIPEYNVEQETIDTILPRYATPQVSRTIQENIEDLKTIKDAIYVNPSIVDKLADKYIVTDGKEWHRPSDLYIRSNDIRTGFALMKGILDFKYLSDAYTDNSPLSIRLDTDFFKKIGCHPTIRVIQVTEPEYLNAVTSYLGRNVSNTINAKIFSKTYISTKLNWRFTYEGFQSLFNSMSFDKSLQIARFLNPNTIDFDIRGSIVAAEDQHFSGKKVDSVEAYTMIGLALSHEKWIYTVGKDTPQRPVDVDRKDIRPEYRQAKRIIELLPFKEEKNPLIEFLSKSVSNEGDREILERFLSKPEDLVKIATALARNEAREEAKKGKAKGILDLIQGADKSQQDGGQKTNGLDINPISEAAKKRREDNLDKALAESMNQEIYVAKGLQFANRISNEEEKQFLLSEYSGVCQICEKQIIKHDGKEYFEAINIIKFSDMMAHLAQSSQLGWNSLCLCPNCAAEYNYCSKKISTIYEQVMKLDVIPDSDEPLCINIEMPQGYERIIHYSPRHFMALKEAFKIFTKEQ